MHIVLDIDGTLISEDNYKVVRPYLYEFLKYCFGNFKTVNIFTAMGKGNYHYKRFQILLLFFK
jgi:hydroxymethylpyrimidine pyrophosphatase-like HAD family hydrolase